MLQRKRLGFIYLKCSHLRVVVTIPALGITRLTRLIYLFWYLHHIYLLIKLLAQNIRSVARNILCWSMSTSHQMKMEDVSFRERSGLWASQTWQTVPPLRHLDICGSKRILIFFLIQENSQTVRWDRTNSKVTNEICLNPLEYFKDQASSKS